MPPEAHANVVMSVNQHNMCPCTHHSPAVRDTRPSSRQIHCSTPAASKDTHSDLQGVKVAGVVGPQANFGPCDCRIVLPVIQGGELAQVTVLAAGQSATAQTGVRGTRLMYHAPGYAKNPARHI